MQVQETLVFSAGMVKREDVIGGSVEFCNSDFYYARGVWYKTVACVVHSNLRLIIEYKLLKITFHMIINNNVILHYVVK